MDQPRFDKMFHSGRSLAMQGRNPIFDAMGSFSATSHSYRLILAIGMYVTRLVHMQFPVVEPSGQFVANRTAEFPGVKAYAICSENMIKGDLNILEQVLQESLTKCCCPIIRLRIAFSVWSIAELKTRMMIFTTRQLLLASSSIRSLFLRILQASVFFFRPCKNMVKFITYPLVFSSSVKVQQRERSVRPQSLFTLSSSQGDSKR